MLAVLIERPGHLKLLRMDEPQCGRGEVLVRSSFAGICQTDLKILRGALPPDVVRYPCIPGHEWSGVIAGIGPGVRDIAVGDRVACEARIPCERCPHCLRGDTNICARYDQLGFTRPGGCAELVVAPARFVHRLPDHVSLEAGAMVE